MPINSIHGKSLDRQRRVMPQVFAGGENEAGAADEDRRRRVSAQGKAPAQVATGLPQAEQPTATPSPQKPPVAATPIDRVHKESISKYGGYIYVMRDHDASESDQMPPTNPGYRGAGTVASSITDAYNFAVTRSSLLKAGARIAIVAVGGSWTESPISINTPGIDFIGLRQPQITGKFIVNPTADTNFYDLDITTVDDVGAITMTVRNTDTDPRIIPSTLVGVRLYGGKQSFYSERRFYAEHCEFHQTTKVDPYYEIGACGINLFPGQVDFTRLKDCKFYAFNDQVNDGGVLFNMPFGFGCTVTGKGPYFTIKILGNDSWIPINTGVVFDQCEMFGSLLVDSFLAEHKGCRVHGGIPTGTGIGRTYLRSRGTPVYDPVAGYYADVASYTTLDHCQVHSSVLAEFVQHLNTTQPGRCYLALRHSDHMMRYNGAAGSPVLDRGAVRLFEVANSSTGCSTWNTPAQFIHGTSPLNVTANREFYMM